MDQSTLLNFEVILFEIENLFVRVQKLPLQQKAFVLEKIRLKLYEEFANLITLLRTEIGNQSWNNLKVDAANWMLSKNISQLYDIAIKTKNVAKEAEKSSELTCGSCQKKFATKKNFKKHLMRHNKESEFECAVCGAKFNAREYLVCHLKIHLAVKNYPCDFCQKTFIKKCRLRNHVERMHKKDVTYKCDRCDYTSHCQAAVKSHAKMKHDPDRVVKFACVVCYSVQASRPALRAHLRSHTGEKPFGCAVCSGRFATAAALRAHSASHENPRQLCTECGKIFKTSQALTRHALTHTRFKPFACPYCPNYASNARGNLTKHVRNVHQMEGFTVGKFNRRMEEEAEGTVREDWIRKGRETTLAYLQELSSKRGEEVTLEGLIRGYLGSRGVQVTNSRVDVLPEDGLLNEQTQNQWDMIL